MKRIAVWMMALLMAVCLTGCAKKQEAVQSAEPEDDTFVVGMECNYAPFNWTQTEDSETAEPIADGSGYADGYDVRIARHIADALGKELVIQKIEWDGLTLALRSGKIDAIIAGMAPTEERAATIDFTDPYYDLDLVIVVRKDSPLVNAASLSEFAGAKITGQINTTHYAVIDQIPEVEKQTAMADFPAMIVALQSGAIDGYVAESPSALAAANANEDLTFVRFAEGQGFTANEDELVVSVGLKQGESDALCEEINAALAELSAEEREQLMEQVMQDQPLSE